jgi:hypothetical protein
MAKQKAPDARLERDTADGLFAKPSSLILSGYRQGMRPFLDHSGCPETKIQRRRL